MASLIGVNRNSTADEYNVRDEIALVESAAVGWTRVFYSMLETKETELMATFEDDDSYRIKPDRLELIIHVS